VGPRWALLPSAAGFVDPLLSTGFPLTLSGVGRIGSLLVSHWQRPSFESELAEYARLTLQELDTAALLVGTLYATMDRFEVFAQLSLLYSAAASFSETARRLGKSQLADSFLLCRNPVFANHLAEICAVARQSTSAHEIEGLTRRICAAIEPFDVAGLTDGSRHPWYPALTADMLRNGPKLGASGTEIVAMLRKCGLQID
jgi:FADH2 O2-dependent halogenase